jgi:AmmeMemoRadiSam system protein A
LTHFDLGRAVLALARSAIAERLRLGTLATFRDPSLDERRASFVTLKLDDQLRGCVGSVERRRALRDDVCVNAVAAGFGDPRFAPLQAREFAQISIEVSVLSAEERIEVASEEELIARLRPGVDGLMLEYGRHRGTLLPQVWQDLQDPQAFVAAVKLKAGLPEDFWSPAMIVSRYAATTWAEHASEIAELHSCAHAAAPAVNAAPEPAAAQPKSV